MDVTQGTFDREVLEASARQPVLVDFWAPWCAPCRVLGPVLEKLEREAAGRWRLAKVNLDENPELAARYGVRSIPNVIAFRRGKAAGSFLGALPESQVRGFLARLADLERLDEAEALIGAERAEEAERLLGEIAPDAELDARREALLAAAGFARAGGAGAQAELEAKLAAQPEDLDARFRLAQVLAGKRRYATPWRSCSRSCGRIKPGATARRAASCCIFSRWPATSPSSSPSSVDDSLQRCTSRRDNPGPVRKLPLRRAHRRIKIAFRPAPIP